MNIITGPRASGKTTKAIELANEKGAYLAVRTKHIANHIYYSDEYPDLDRFPITHHELIGNGADGSFVRNVVIDDVDHFIRVASRGMHIEGLVIGHHLYQELEDMT